MDHKDEFSKWVASIEEALTEDNSIVDEDLLEQGSCGGCSAWNCPECFPDVDNSLDDVMNKTNAIPEIVIINGQIYAPAGESEIMSLRGQGNEIKGESPPEQGIGMAGTHPVGDDTYDHSEEDEIDIANMGPDVFDEEEEVDDGEQESTPLPRSDSGGVKLGDIVQKFVKAGGDIMGAAAELEESPMDRDDDFDHPEEYEMGSPLSRGEYHDEGSQIDPEQAMEMIDKIMYMQNTGLSNGQTQYTEDQLAQLPPNKLQAVYQQVLGTSQSGTTEDTMQPDTSTMNVPVPSTATNPPPQPTMETTLGGLLKNLAEEFTLGHIVQQFKPSNSGINSPLTYGEENLDEEDNDCSLESAAQRLLHALGSDHSELGEDDMMAQGATQQPVTGGTLGASSGGGASAGTNYAPGTAPTMPESVNNFMEDDAPSTQYEVYDRKTGLKTAGPYNTLSRARAAVDRLDNKYGGYRYGHRPVARSETTQGSPTMENIDKDVAAMLKSLKKYDKLTEGVLGMTNVGMARPKVVAETGKPWEKDEDKEEIDEKDEGKHNNGTTTGFKAVAKKAAEEYGSKEAGEKVAGAVRNKMKASGKIEESAPTPDPEVLEWMSRFSKLGNMKGYGR